MFRFILIWIWIHWFVSWNNAWMDLKTTTKIQLCKKKLSSLLFLLNICIPWFCLNFCYPDPDPKAWNESDPTGIRIRRLEISRIKFGIRIRRLEMSRIQLGSESEGLKWAGSNWDPDPKAWNEPDPTGIRIRRLEMSQI